MKIIVVSDNHSNFDVLHKIVKDNPDGDYYWHLGDSEACEADELKPFVSVRGNNDFLDLPMYRVIEVASHRFLLTHGHRYLRYDLSDLYYLGKEQNCDVVLYGHTHMFSDYEYEDIRLINPGSCSHNRDGNKPSYIILNVNEKDIEVIKKEI